jgi:MFS family permease
MALYHDWIAQFQKFNLNIKLSFMMNIFTQVGMGIFMVIYNFYIRDLGFTEAVNGQVIAMGSLATAIILVPAGLISDRFGRKKVIFLGIILSGIILLFRSIIFQQDLLVSLAFIGGLTIAFFQVSSIP